MAKFILTESLYQRDFLKIMDYSAEEINTLLTLAAHLKHARKTAQEVRYLTGKQIALIFEKPSTRTRCAFEVAANEQGANTTYLGTASSQLGSKESIKDTARVLERLYHGIEYRGYDQAIVEELAQYAQVPVWNGLTQQLHPTQALADLLTIQEYSDKPLSQLSLCYVGNADNNTSNSLMKAAALMGMDYRVACPVELAPPTDYLQQAQRMAAHNGGKLLVTSDLAQACWQADFIYTDVWLSMGEPDNVWQTRVEQLLPYQINAKVIAACGNPNVKFMHCLPAFHNTETEVGRIIEAQYGLTAMEVTEEVFEGPQSIVFDQAENRLHTIKALLVATLSEVQRFNVAEST